MTAAQNILMKRSYQVTCWSTMYISDLIFENNSKEKKFILIYQELTLTRAHVRCAPETFSMKKNAFIDECIFLTVGSILWNQKICINLNFEQFDDDDEIEK